MRMLFRHAGFIACVVVATIAHAQTAKAVSADARLQELYRTEWKWREEQFADNEDTQRPVVDHLPKVDPASQEMRLRYWEEVLRKLDGIARAELSAPDHEILTEVDRYIAWPAQALSYYLGELAIVKARAKAESLLGAKFNIRAFQ